MNLVEVFNTYGRRGVRAYLRAQWAPSTYSSARRARDRARTKAARKQWGHRMSTAIRCRDTDTISDLLTSTPDGVQVPEMVFETLRSCGYRQCYHDNRWYHQSEMTWMRRQDVYIYDENMEEAGVFTCSHCEHAFTGDRGRVQVVDTYDIFCGNSCADRHGVFRTEEGRVYSCEAAAPPVYIYRYNQTFVGPIGTQDSYPIGIELEIEFDEEETKHEFAALVREKYPRDVCHCKRDGSLSECGVELITGYGPYNELSPVITDVAAIARGLGGRSHGTDTCGTHISVGRQQMSFAQQARFVVFFNHPKNQEFLFAFARRNSARFAVTIPTKATDEFIRMCDEDYDRLMGDKYEAVNCNHRTHLEVRIFKGSLNTNTILARLAMVRLVGEWCEQDLSAKELLAPQWLKWLKSRGADCEMFNNIEQYMKRRQIAHLLQEEAAC